MKQRTLAMMTGFEQYTRKTRRAVFLEEMEQVVPWRELCALVAPHYPQPGKGRPPVGVERMLRIYFLQQWFNLSDPGVEEALYDSAVMRQFVGVDSKTKIIHTAVATAANVADSAVLPDLLHGEETRVWGDQAYRGQSEVIRECAPQAQDCTHRRYRYKHGIDEVERAKNRTKSRVRSKVEHVFAVMKLKFGFVKLRFRGLKKNATQLFAVCALVNLYLARKKLLLLAPA